MQFDIRRFDIYRKVPKDLTQPTITGACISVCSIIFISFLFIFELSLFITVEVISELTVEDPVQHAQKIPVFINVTLPRLECKYIGLDIQDQMGRHEVGFLENVEKIELDNGKGCRFEAHFMINKIPGNFHISTHSAEHQPLSVDMAHTIHKVRFGMDTRMEWRVKGSFNPLENLYKVNSDPSTTFQYIIRIVPTVHEDIDGSIHFPFQYTYSNRDNEHGGIPAIWFQYDLSPITVKYQERRKPFYTFLTTVCAIVGGTFTVAGIIDSFIFTASEIFKKAELGKLT